MHTRHPVKKVPAEITIGDLAYVQVKSTVA